MAIGRALDWEEVPCHVIADLDDALKSLLAERDENTCREDMTLSEKVAIGRALEALERPRAKARQKLSEGPGQKRCENFTHLNLGKTRDKVGAAIGMSGVMYQRARTVTEAAEADPEKFGDLVGQMERTNKVSPAYDEMRKRTDRSEGVPMAIGNEQAKNMTAHGFVLLQRFRGGRCVSRLEKFTPARRTYIIAEDVAAWLIAEGHVAYVRSEGGADVYQHPAAGSTDPLPGADAKAPSKAPAKSADATNQR